MEDTKPQYDDEIDLVELFKTIWDGKWKIFSFVVASLISVVVFQITLPSPNFTATTEIKPIMSTEAERYRVSNAVGFFEVKSLQLLNLYIEQLEERSLFEEAIRNFNLLDAEEYDSEQAFDEAIVLLASSIEVLPPVNADGAERGDVRRFWTIVFEYNDEDKWKSVLSSVNSSATEAVRQTLQQRFATSLTVTKQLREFQLDDLQTQIDNALTDYERKSSDRLAFLDEQFALAKQLKIAKSTIEAQTFSSANNLITNVKTDTPYYLRGYESIGKEIELIEARSDKKAFINGLLELEQKQREIEQDKTLQRAEALFASTPIMSSADFSAVAVSTEATDFKTNNKRILLFALAIVIGGIIGAIYVLISSAIRKRKEQLVKV